MDYLNQVSRIGNFNNIVIGLVKRNESWNVVELLFPTSDQLIVKRFFRLSLVCRSGGG
jgi:hypothetical protein